MKRIGHTVGFVFICRLLILAQVYKADFTEWKVQLYNDSGRAFPLRWLWKPNPAELILCNAEERISCTRISRYNDSTIIELPVFQTELRLQMSDTVWKGFWINRYKTNPVAMRLEGRRQKQHVHSDTALAAFIKGDWVLTWDDSTEALARFFWNARTQMLSGTVLTETGDYRYLEGQIQQGHLQMTAFDGLHAFLFEGNLPASNTQPLQLKGRFYSGPGHFQSWKAQRKPGFSLANPETLTQSRTNEPLHFTFTGLDGTPCNLDDKQFKNKAVIIQIMGSWCPNCMDESRYFATLYPRFAAEGLEIIALAFEKSDRFEQAQAGLLKMRRDLQLPYTLLYAGSSQKIKASKQLPWLTEIKAYPTTLFLNRQHCIVATHTGFSGPATGTTFIQYCQRTERIIQKLLK